MSAAAIIAAAALAENIVLAKMLGLCPFAGLSRRLDIALGIGLATTFILTASSAAAWALNHFLLAEFSALQAPAFIALAAVFVQGAEHIMRLGAPRMHRMLGVYLPLITTNCAVLAVMLLAVRGNSDSLQSAALQGFGGGLGFMLAVAGLALARGRVVESKTPALFRGAPLTMITAGWMALAFSGLAGAF
ncbi:MAG: electron transport complex protein RnfA [Gammaproteobacteria bacterium]